MAEKDINGMRAQNWTAKDTSLTEKARDDNKSKVTDTKLSKLYEALTEVIITSVKDSYGKNSDKKYIYLTDMLMSRVRKALTEKLSDLQIDSIKQLVIDNTKLQDVLLSKMLLNAFSTLSVKIDKNSQAKLVEKIAVVVNKLLKSYVAKNLSSKSNSNDKLTEIISALKSSSKSQATHKAKEAEIKRYQSKAYKLISKTLAAVNLNHTIAILSMTAGFKHTTETISNEVSSLQDKIEDANSGSSIMSLIPQLKNASAIAKFANPMSWFKLFVVNPMKLLFSGLWNFLLKPMFYVGKFLLKPIGYLVKGIWDNFIKKPIAKLIELTGTVLGAVTSAATTALSVFFLTPKGAYMLGYIVGYVWSRWILPIVTPILKFADKHILPLLKSITKWSFDTIINLMTRVGKPLLEWIKGESSFNDAIKKVIFGDDIYKKDDKGNILKDKDGKPIIDTWAKLLSKTAQHIIDEIFENHPVIGRIISGTAKFAKDHPFIAAIGAYLGITAAVNPFDAILGTVKSIYTIIKIAKATGPIGLAVTAGITAFWIGTKIYKWLEKKADEADIQADVSLTELDKHVSDTYKAHLDEIAKVTNENYATIMAHVGNGQNVEQLFTEYEKLKEWRNIAEADIKRQGYKFDGTIGEYALNDVYFKSHPFHTAYTIPSSKDEAFGLYEQAKLRMKELETQYNLTESDFEALNGKENIIARLKRLFKTRVDNAITANVFSQHKYNELKLEVEKNTLSTITPFGSYSEYYPLQNISSNIKIDNKSPVTMSTQVPVAEQQVQVDNLLSDMLKPLGTAAYLVRMQNDKFEEVKKELIREESNKQISLLAKDASKKAAEQSALLTAKEYKNAMEAALDIYGIKMSKLHEANRDRLDKAMLEDVRNNQDEFLKRMDKLQTTLEKMYLSKGKNEDYAKYWSNEHVLIYRDLYAPMRNKDRYTVDPITNGNY